MKVPQYQQPALDPSYAALMQQTKQQDVEALQFGQQQETSSNAARFGIAPGSGGGLTPSPTSAAPASLLALYGAKLAMANAGA